MTWNSWKLCLSKGYKISPPLVKATELVLPSERYPELFWGENADTQGTILKCCLLFHLECHTSGWLACLKPVPHATERIYADIHPVCPNCVSKVLHKYPIYPQNCMWQTNEPPEFFRCLQNIRGEKFCYHLDTASVEKEVVEKWS